MSKNFARSVVVTAPSPATSGTTVAVTAGHGVRFVAGPAVVCPAVGDPTPENAEVVTISGVAGDVLTVVRAVESSVARAIVAGDRVLQGLTAAQYDALVVGLASKADAVATTAALAGKAAVSHVHSAADVTSGTLPLARGGTGGTDAATARTSLGLGSAATQPVTAFAAAAAVTAALGAPSTATTGTLTAGQMALVDATSAACARTLPAANSVPAGTVTGVKKIDGSANAVTVNRAGADTITGTAAGQTSRALTLAGESIELTSDGTSVWVITSTDTPSTVLSGTYGPGGTAGNAGLAGPNVFTGTQDFTGATVTGIAGGSAVDIGPSTGDVTGAGDYALIQAALTAARTAGGGKVVGRVGQTYLINDTLQIGTGTWLDMTGCTVRMVSGSNKIMLANYSSLNPITTTGKITVGAGQTLWTLESTIDPAYVALNADPGKGAGWTFDVPMTISAVAVRFVGTIGANGMNSGTRQLGTTFGAQYGGTPAAVAGYTLFNLYRRDTRVIVTGGIWDRQDNGTGDTATNHVFRWRGIDGLTQSGQTFLSTGFSNGRYAVLAQNITSAHFENITYGLNPSQGLWSGTAGYARDGVHLTGPAENVTMKRLYGFPGDDMAAITASDFTGVAGDYWGHVRQVVIEDVMPTSAGACAVKIMGGPQTRVERITVRNVLGSTGGSAGHITIGDDNRQVSTTGGLYDNITLENILGANGNGNVTVVAGSGLGTLTIRGIGWESTTSTAKGVIAVGTNLYAAGNQPTTIDNLIVDGMSIKAMNAATRAIYVETGSVIKTLTMTNWRNPHTSMQTVGGPGTIRVRRIGGLYVGDAYRPVRTGVWYPSSPTASLGDVFQVFTQDKLYLGVPRIAQEPITISQLGISTNVVGSAGAVARLGIYLIDGEDPFAVTLGSAWATLLAGSEGTVATDGTTGVKTVTLGAPVVIGIGQEFTVGVVDQVAGPASHRLRSQTSVFAGPNPWGAATVGSNPQQVLSMTGVTGALPTSFVPSAFEGMNAGSDHGAWFLRSA